jgi:hypothetical protein
LPFLVYQRSKKLAPFISPPLSSREQPLVHGV